MMTKDLQRIRERMSRRAFRTHDELIAAMVASLKVLPAIGAGLIGASAIATIVGAFYIQAFLETLQAGWAMDYVPYASMLRTGALAISLAVLATVFCLVNAARRPGGWVVSNGVFWPVLTLVLAVLVVRSANPRWAEGSRHAMEVFLSLASSLLVGMVATLVISKRPRTAEHRSLAIGVGFALVLAVVCVQPWQQGQLDALSLLEDGPTQQHPFACAGADTTPWHVVRPMGSSVLLARINNRKLSTLRLVPGEAVLVMGPEAPNAPCPASMSH